MKLRIIKKMQQGSMLLEALIGILIFSMGILAMVGLQAAAISSVTEAKYRSDAAFFANQIIGEMWVQRDDLANKFRYPYGTSPTLAPWVSKVAASLPGIAGTTNRPSIMISACDVATTGCSVTVTLYWQPGNTANPDNPPPPRSFTQTAFIHNP